MGRPLAGSLQSCWRESADCRRGTCAGLSTGTAALRAICRPVAAKPLEEYTPYGQLCRERGMRTLSCRDLRNLQPPSYGPFAPTGRGRTGGRSREARPIAAFDAGSSHFTIEQRDGRLFHRESRSDEQGRIVAEVEAEVTYALGSGTRGISYLVERAGRLYQSPISWFGQRQRWDLSPGYEEKNQHFDRADRTVVRLLPQQSGRAGTNEPSIATKSPSSGATRSAVNGATGRVNCTCKGRKLSTEKT